VYVCLFIVVHRVDLVKQSIFTIMEFPMLFRRDKLGERQRFHPFPPQQKREKVQICADNGKRRWEIVGNLGKGGCGDVFLARETGAELVALKIVKDKKQFAQELLTMRVLNHHPKGRGGLLLTSRYWRLTAGRTPKLIMGCRRKRALVMEYLNDTLSMQFEKCAFSLSLKTILMLALDMLNLQKDFYEKTGQVHVDLKPSNFCTGPDGKGLYLIDFGYATSPSIRLPGQVPISNN
jgi:serine/threonine protein kinase